MDDAVANDCIEILNKGSRAGVIDECFFKDCVVSKLINREDTTHMSSETLEDPFIKNLVNELAKAVVLQSL